MDKNREHIKQSKRQWNRDNPDKIKSLNLKRYGITLEQYNRLLIAQGGRCKICDKTEHLHVDHDHRTGKVRGLLCSNHNTGLGKFQDDIETLEKAIVYLKESRIDQDSISDSY